VSAPQVNLFGDEWDDERDRPGWRWKRLQVVSRLGARQLGGSLYELEPGQKTFPFHFHHAIEEWLVVLRREPTLRDESGERRLSTGDCVLFPRGPGGAHQVRNDTEDPVRLLMMSSAAEVEIAVYPDSGKIGAMARVEGVDPFRLVVRQESAVDYFDGEE
jgi:uncharacterized cupin superfamily protein